MDEVFRRARSGPSLGLRLRGLVRVIGFLVFLVVSSRSLAELAVEPETVVARGAAGDLSCGRLQQFVVSQGGARHWTRLRSQEDGKRLLVRHLTAESRLAQEAETARLGETPATKKLLVEKRDKVLLRALENDLAAGPEISETDAQKAYERQRQRFHTPPRLVSRFIMLHLKRDAGELEIELIKQRLEEIRQKYLAGASFGELAQRFSQAENAARGGTVAASPRHSLLPAYEEIAWSLEDGDVSQPVRLRDGMALILKERIFPARHRSFEKARSGIMERLREEAVRTRRQAVLAQARARWPLVSESADGEPVWHLDGSSFTLANLGLRHRPPFLERRIEQAMERQWLLRWAEHQGVDKRAKVVTQLRWMRQRILASIRLDELVTARLARPAEGLLRARYERRRQALSRPAERRFEALILAGEEGKMRRVKQQAEALAETWRETGKAPSGIEKWGPLRRDVLTKSLSPLFSERAFSLALGAISAPLRLETYSAEKLKFVGRGYAVPRMLDEQPSTPLTFEQARPRLISEASHRPVRLLRTQLTQEVVSRPPLDLDEQALSACQLPAQAID